MSGFGAVVGFMFAFFVVAATFMGTFVVFEKQIADQQLVLENSQKESEINMNYDYELLSPFVSSGRVNFIVNNTGKENLFFLKDDIVCFSSFVNGIFIAEEDMFGNVFKHIPNDYIFFEKKDVGVFSLKKSVNTNVDNSFKLISCSGLERNYVMAANEQNWWDENWLLRKEILVKDNSGSDLAEYQIELDLNSSNFDFSLGKEDEVRFVLSIKENLMLDLTFDDYAESLIDYSDYSNTASLGGGLSTDGDEPLESAGVIMGGLDFDGTNDFVNVSFDASLQSSKGVTYAGWVKWDTTGGVNQTIFSNGGDSNSLSIVNDGGVNDDNVLFELNLSGTVQKLYSGNVLNSKWHFIAATFDGYEMKLYIDGVLTSNSSYFGDISVGGSDSYIGRDSTGNFFSGHIDEFKVFSLPLSSTEVEDLYYNNLRFRELDFYVSDWDSSIESAKVFVKVPSVLANSNVSFGIYYDNRNGVSSSSDIETAFSYLAPRTVGYVVSNRDANSNGLNIFSLYDNNIIYVDTDSFALDEQQGSTLAQASVSLGDVVSMKYLAQVEGQASSGSEMVVPISWAGTEFYYRGMRNNPDRVCMVSPFGNANVDILEDGVLLGSVVIGSSVVCNNSMNIGTGSNLGIESDIPVLVASYGDTSDDSMAWRPATNDDLFGVPSGALYVGAGSTGASGTAYESDGSSSALSMGAYGTYGDTVPGAEGDSPAFRLSTDGVLGAIEQGDGDGAESSVFATLYDMGVKFGSHEATEYIVMASPYFDANCSVYDSTGSLIENKYLGTGSSSVGVYNYSFGIIDNVLYTAADWKLECDKPVWPYYEDSSEDETNLFGHMQMRQYIYPEPTVTLS